MSILGTAFSAGGFLRATIGSAPANPRMMLYQQTDGAGKPLKDAQGNDLYTAFNTYVAIAEDHQHDLQTTDHPVEQGALITDHAYKLPVNLTMRIAWSASSPNGALSIPILGVTLPTFTGLLGLNSGNGQAYIKSIFRQLITLQQKRTLIDVYTGKIAYKNMLIVALNESTTEMTENALVVTVRLKEIIFVETRAVNVPVNQKALATPEKSSPTTESGTKPAAPPSTFNPSPAARPPSKVEPTIAV